MCVNRSTPGRMIVGHRAMHNSYVAYGGVPYRTTRRRGSVADQRAIRDVESSGICPNRTARSERRGIIDEGAQIDFDVLL